MGGTVSTDGVGDDATVQQDTFDLMPGMMVGEYRIEGPLGSGGMGRVYAAIHPVIAKRAAIKVLHPELSVNREAIDRFIQEARSVNQIGHPNIVDIFAFGVLPDGRHYFVMEWLRGESLRQRLARAPIALVDALGILETITLALEAAHDQGIVHRDLKPDNVFLVEVKGHRPQVKLLDFGIAKLLGPQGVQRTQTGNMLGTPAYVSPEQARAQAVDHRTDIYALGAMMFELMTGELVFPADNAADMIAKHLLEPPRSAAALNPIVPPELDALIAAMLAKEAAQRPTLATIRAALSAAQSELPRSAMSRRFRTPQLAPGTVPGTAALATATAPQRSRTPVIVASAILAIGLGIGTWYLLGDRVHTADVAAPVAPTPVLLEPSPQPPPAIDAMVVEQASEIPKPADTPTPADTPKPRPTGTRPVTHKPAGTTKPTEKPQPKAGSTDDEDAPM